MEGACMTVNEVGLTHLDENGSARMVRVSEKILTRRTAVAGCEILMRPETLELLKSGKLKKGDAFTVAKVAGILAVKKTPDLIPLCHPLSIESIEIRFKDRPTKDGVTIEAEVETTAKTGVEMEALTGATVSALTLYDMAKSYDPGMTITEVHLIQKRGGNSDYTFQSRNSNGK